MTCAGEAAGGALGILAAVRFPTSGIRSGGDGGAVGKTWGAVGADGRALRSALPDPGGRPAGLVVGGWPLTQEPGEFAYAGLSAGSDSAARCRSILSSARDALVR